MGDRQALAFDASWSFRHSARPHAAVQPLSAEGVHGSITRATGAVLSDFGVDPTRLLREAGCDPWAVRGNGGPVSNAALGRLLQLGALSLIHI